MKKNFQLFIFFLFTLLSGFLVYMGNEIILRLNEVESTVTNFQKEVDNIKGAVQVIKKFNNTQVLKEKSDYVIPDAEKIEAKSLQPIQGFYCATEIDDISILELLPNGKMKYWELPTAEEKSFSRERKPDSTGSYIIKGSQIYFTVRFDGHTQNRKASILKVDSKGYIEQLEGVGKFFSNEICPKVVLLSY